MGTKEEEEEEGSAATTTTEGRFVTSRARGTYSSAIDSRVASGGGSAEAGEGARTGEGAGAEPLQGIRRRGAI